MKVHELLEAADSKFIGMMNQILGDIPELKRKSSELNQTIKAAAAAVPALFQKQADLEAWMSAAVKVANLIPNKMLQPHLHELQGLEKQYHKNTSVLDMLSFHLPFFDEYKRVKSGRPPMMSNDGDEWTPVVMEFIKNHGEDLKDTIRAVDMAYDKIRQMANKEKWPAPWSRYGSLPANQHAFKRTKEELLNWIDELSTT